MPQFLHLSARFYLRRTFSLDLTSDPHFLPAPPSLPESTASRTPTTARPTSLPINSLTGPDLGSTVLYRAGCSRALRLGDPVASHRQR